MAANRAPLTREDLLGAWRMTSRTYEIVGTGERRRFLHFLGGTTIDLNRNFAIAQTKLTI